MSKLEDRARAEYEACQTAKPDWDQLGEVTKNVWRERVNPPKLRTESAIGLFSACLCRAGVAAMTTMHDNCEVMIVAPNEAKLAEALQRFPAKTTAGKIEVVVFHVSQVELDDEI